MVYARKFSKSEEKTLIIFYFNILSILYYSKNVGTCLAVIFEVVTWHDGAHDSPTRLRLYVVRLYYTYTTLTARDYSFVSKIIRNYILSQINILCLFQVNKINKRHLALFLKYQNYIHYVQHNIVKNNGKFDLSKLLFLLSFCWLS